jgi:hypothetical protein
MAEVKGLDIAHVTFLEMIETFIRSLGPAAAKGHLMRSALKTADKLPAAAFASLEEFTAAIADLNTPIARIEGKAVHLGNGLFGLPKCPFGESVANYKAISGSLPESFAEVTADFNKPSPMTEEYEIGHGSGVSPFCSIHQPLRSALARKITIGGNTVKIYELGCKSSTGQKAIADTLVAKTAFTREQVDRVLDDHMCCYGLVVAQ